MSRKKFQLSRLREIGWSLWDPIGLAESRDQNFGIDDEYDSYLLQAITLLDQGIDEATVAALLIRIETEHMGLRPQPDTKDRALATAKALKAYLDSQDP